MKAEVCKAFPSEVSLKGNESDLPHFLHSAAWNLDVKTGALATILDHGDEGHTLGMVKERT